MNKQTITDIDVAGKKVLVRVDFNVPLSSKNRDDNITVTDDTRIRAALPTINYLLDKGAALILCSHLGRPKSADDAHLRMTPVATTLSQLLQRPVHKAESVVGESVTQLVANANPGDVILLENSRFEKGEKKNDPSLSQALADLADVYVNDAFGSAHRAHASTEGAARAMKAKGGPAVGGFLMQKELEQLGMAVENPPHPYVAIMGGAKVSDKIQLIDNLLERADKILIGGGMANTFFKAMGLETGTSLVEDDALREAQKLMTLAGNRLVLPVDLGVADKFDRDAARENVPFNGISAEKTALDIGPATVDHFRKQLEGAALVVWNGPMGVFEFPTFAQGTFALADLLAAAVDSGTQVIIGGGDSAAAVKAAGLKEKMTHVSTGGGASLELLQGESLPGIAILDDNR